MLPVFALAETRGRLGLREHELSGDVQPGEGRRGNDSLCIGAIGVRSIALGASGEK